MARAPDANASRHAAAPATAAPAPAGGQADGGEDIYTRHIATPTGLDFAKAAALYGLAHQRVATTSELRTALERALSPESGSTIVHVRGDRAHNVELHRRVWSAVSAAI